MKYVTRTINELCLKITDGAHNSPEEDIHGRYPMYSSKDMLYGDFDTENIKMISDEDYHRLVKQDCRPLKNDVLIIKDGNSYLKYVFRVKEDLDAVILSSIAVLRPNCKEIDPDFFVYILRTNSIRNAMANYVSGAAIPRIVLKDFKKMKLQFLEDKSLQAEIASILLNYDNLIENNNKRIKILEQMAENLYKEWFVRFRFPRHEDAAFDGGIPRGWEIEKIGNIGEVIGGGTPSTDIIEYWDGEIPWLTPADLAAFDGVYIAKGSKSITEIGLKKSSTKLMPKDTVLLSSRAPIGYVALAKNEICTNQGFKSVVCDEKRLLHQYLFYFFKMNKPLLEGYGSGATFLELSGGALKKIKLLLPPINIQKAFANIVDDCFEQIYALSEENNNLQKQRDLLLPRLMSGKLQVK